MVVAEKTYNASIRSFIDTAIERWGTPEKNKDNLVTYGILPLDLALYGLDVVNGEMVVVQGLQKNRKTTFVENVIVNYMLNPMNASKRPFTVVDMLESGMKPAKYVDTLICNVASRKLIAEGHQPDPKIACKPCGGTGGCKELHMHYKFLLYNKRSPVQQRAIEWAMGVMRDWPMYIYGPSVDEGNTKDLDSSVAGAKILKSRWQRLIEEKNARVFVTDHLQQYSMPGTMAYEKMETVVAAHADVVAKFGIVDFLISQVSMGSAKDAAAGIGKFTAMGGGKAAQEGNTVFTTNYTSSTGFMAVTVEESRDAGSGWSVKQSLEENSGAFYGAATRIENMQFRPGMEAEARNGNGRR